MTGLQIDVIVPARRVRLMNPGTCGNVTTSSDLVQACRVTGADGAWRHCNASSVPTHLPRRRAAEGATPRPRPPADAEHAGLPR